MEQAIALLCRYAGPYLILQQKNFFWMTLWKVNWLRCRPCASCLAGSAGEMTAADSCTPRASCWLYQPGYFVKNDDIDES